MTWLWTILLLLIIFSFSIYWLYWKPQNYLEELGIPYYRANIITSISYIFKIIFKTAPNLYELEITKYKKYGRMFGSHEIGYPVLSIADPDLLRKILVKDFHIFHGRRSIEMGDEVADNFLSVINGEKWKRIRTIISPAFSTGKIKRMTNIIISSAKTLAQNFASKTGETIDGKTFFNTFTMDVIASTAFGTKIYSYQDPNNRFVIQASKIFKPTFSWRLLLAIVCPKLAVRLGISLFDSSVMNFFKEETLKIIEDRKKNGVVKNDFLQLLMDAEKEHEQEENANAENAETEHEEDNFKIFKSSKQYKSLNHNELLAQCLVFFLAGFEATATTLSIIFHVLAVNSDIQEKLREEVDSAISAHDNQLTYEALQEMKYLDNVISETLRMYPPAFRIERIADADYELEGTGITVRKGTVIAVPVSALQHDPEFYPEPSLFKPERFTLEGKALRDPYAYLTFGVGPRNCVGMRFALMEIKLCISYMISQLVIKKCSETKVPLEISSPLGILRPNVKFTVEKRNNNLFDGL